MARTHYGELGVARDADEGAIRAAYRAAMRRHHPDTNRSPDATGRSARINAAWACLRDPDRRRDYDRGLREVEQVRADVRADLRRGMVPPLWRTPPPPPPDPLPIAVFVFAAVIAIVPTMLLVALSHGWDGHFTHPAHAAAPVVRPAPPAPSVAPGPAASRPS